MFRVWEIWPLEIRVPCVQASLTKSGESFSILIDYSFFDVDIFESSDWFEEFDCYDIFDKDFKACFTFGRRFVMTPSF